MDAEQPPIACTLGEAALVDRAGAWTEVIDTGLRDRTATEQGIKLRFDAAVEGPVRELVALEAECCEWFAATVTRTGDAVEVDLRALNPDGRVVLRAMFAAR